MRLLWPRGCWSIAAISVLVRGRFLLIIPMARSRRMRSRAEGRSMPIIFRVRNLIKPDQIQAEYKHSSILSTSLFPQCLPPSLIPSSCAQGYFVWIYGYYELKMSFLWYGQSYGKSSFSNSLRNLLHIVASGVLNALFMLEPIHLCMKKTGRKILNKTHMHPNKCKQRLIFC